MGTEPCVRFRRRVCVNEQGVEASDASLSVTHSRPGVSYWLWLSMVQTMCKKSLTQGTRHYFQSPIVDRFTLVFGRTAIQKRLKTARGMSAFFLLSAHRAPVESVQRLNLRVEKER